MIAFSNKSTSQNLEKLSVEFDADYCYYFKIPNDINYGFALLFSDYISDGFRLNVGVEYRKSNLYRDTYYNHGYERNYFHVGYIDYLINGNIRIFSKNKFYTSLFVGISINTIVDYSGKVYYQYSVENIMEMLHEEGNCIGISLMLGESFSYKIRNRLFLHLTPFVNYRIKTDNRIKEMLDHNGRDFFAKQVVCGNENRHRIFVLRQNIVKKSLIKKYRKTGKKIFLLKV